MAGQAQRQYPAIQGLRWYRTQYYSFFVPNNWHQMAWSDDREGVIFGPDLNDPSTVFAVDIQDLGIVITADDLDTLAAGFFESIERLPDSNIELRQQKVVGAVLELEAKYTFHEQGETRRCWVRVFYHVTRQIVIRTQGATPEKYAYWLPWFFEAMMTAKVHATKPESPL